MVLRTELAQEKASLAIIQQEIRDQAAKEARAVRTAHARQSKELEMRLRRVENEKRKMELKGAELKANLKGGHYY